MGEHTEGPWTVKGRHPYLIARVFNFCVMKDTPDTGGETQYSEETAQDARANAQLIAAAPELLEACRWMCQVIETINHEYWDGVSLSTILAMANSTTKAEQAIAKAEGEER